VSLRNKGRKFLFFEQVFWHPALPLSLRKGFAFPMWLDKPCGYAAGGEASEDYRCERKTKGFPQG